MKNESRCWYFEQDQIVRWNPRWLPCNNQFEGARWGR